MNKLPKMTNNLLLLTYFLLMASFFMPAHLNSVALIFCGLISLTQVKKLPLQSLIQSPLLFFPLLFLVLLIGMTYTSNMVHGRAIIERHYSLIFTPFIAASFILLNPKHQKWILNSFVVFTTIAAVYFLGYAIVDYFESGSVYIEGKSGHHLYNKFMHHRLTEPLGMHAVYFALYLSFSFLYLLNLFIKQFGKLTVGQKIGIFLLFVFYALMIILLKSALFALALPSAVILLLFLSFKQQIFKKKKYLIGIVLLLILLGSFSFYGMKSKIINFSTDLDLTEQHPGPLKIRLGVWYSSWQTIKDQWIIGAGTGDGYDALMEKYRELDFYIGKKDRFNAHNMYLQYWINNGLPAVAIYFLLLLALARFFYKQKKYVGLVLIFLFAAFSMTEATMLRQAGIVYFVLFSCLLYFKNNQVDAKTL